MGRRTRLAAGMVAVVLSVTACTDGDDPVEPTPSPTETTTAEPTPTPTPSPVSEEDQAVADAIATYEAFVLASHTFLNDPETEDVQRALILTTEDGSARSGLLAEAEQIEASGLDFDGLPVIMRVSASSIDLETGVILLSSCVDVRELRVNGERTPDQPEFFIEHPEVRKTDGRWLVHRIEGEAGSC